MKILLDENLPHELRDQLIGHALFTMTYLGWRGHEGVTFSVLAVISQGDPLMTVFLF
jgi:hypothetical protein